MIPVLYEANETAFETNGLGRLYDAISCTVTEEVNGIYELSMQYPLNGQHADELQVNKIIYAVPSVGKAPQPFRIRDFGKSIGNKIQITARHVKNELAYYVVKEFGSINVLPYNQKPILYDSGRTVIGVLSDTVSTNVIKNNNTYYLTLVYPNDGRYASNITTSCYIYMQPEVGKHLYSFDITSITTGANNLTIQATGQYQVNPDAVIADNDVTNEIAFAKILTNCLDASIPFTFQAVPYEIGDEWSGRTRVFINEYPRTVQDLIGPDEGCILDLYGGEWEWDHYNCILHEKRGVESNVIYSYGKNITDINAVTNIDELYTHVVSFWKGTTSSSTETDYTQDEYSQYYTKRGHVIKAIEETEEYNKLFPYAKTLAIDASSEFEEEPTEEELDDYSNWYIKQNDIGIPRVSVTVNVIDLASTVEYQDRLSLETVHLCDYVTVVFPAFGITTKEQISKIEFNVLTEKNISVTIGETKMTLADVIAGNKRNIEKTRYDTREWADKCSERSVRAAAGWYGGVLKTKFNETDHKPQSKLLMDSDKESEAGHVLKADKNGVSGSTTGSNGTYNALIALRNPRNEIGVNGSSVNFGKLKTQDSVAANRQSSWDLDTGDAEMILKLLCVGLDVSKDDLVEGLIAIIKGDAKVTGELTVGETKVGEKLGTIDTQIGGIAGSMGTMNQAIADLNTRVTNLGG